MPPREKRSRSSTGSSSASEPGRDAKRQRTTPRRGKWDAVVQDVLDFLSPATAESLANFNDKESKAKRGGVIPIYILLVETELGRLRLAKDIESLEAKLEWIDSYLKDYRESYDRYLKTHHAVAKVRLALHNVVWSIQEARDRLPGMFSDLDELLRKLNVTIHRS